MPQVKSISLELTREEFLELMLLFEASQDMEYEPDNWASFNELKVKAYSINERLKVLGRMS